MKLVLTTPPVSEPLTLEDAKLFLRVSHTLDDALIASLVKTARDKAESITNRQLGVAQYELFQDTVPASFALPKPPLVSVESVQQFVGGAWEDVAYTLDDKAEPALIEITGEAKSDDVANAFRVQYTTGYSSTPDAILTWMRVQVSTWYEQREIFSETSKQNMPRTFVDSLLDSYRVRIV